MHLSFFSRRACASQFLSGSKSRIPSFMNDHHSYRSYRVIFTFHTCKHGMLLRNSFVLPSCLVTNHMLLLQIRVFFFIALPIALRRFLRYLSDESTSPSLSTSASSFPTGSNFFFSSTSLVSTRHIRQGRLDSSYLVTLSFLFILRMNSPGVNFLM